jgi:CubicO group peptidase (beta-lactamase class C family)
MCANQGWCCQKAAYSNTCEQAKSGVHVVKSPTGPDFILFGSMKMKKLCCTLFAILVLSGGCEQPQAENASPGDAIDELFAAYALGMQPRVAVAVIRNGKLSYDDPVGKYVPVLSVYDGVTIRHLMLHTGGLPDYYDFIDTADRLPTNQDAALYLGPG